MSDRIDALLAMLEKRPGDARLRFGLAAEYEKADRWEDVITQLRAYLESFDDQGNAWGRLGAALHKLGRTPEALDAYTRGIDAARRHGHPSMAAEFGAIVDELEDG